MSFRPTKKEIMSPTSGYTYGVQWIKRLLYRYFVHMINKLSAIIVWSIFHKTSETWYQNCDSNTYRESLHYLQKTVTSRSWHVAYIHDENLNNTINRRSYFVYINLIHGAINLLDINRIVNEYKTYLKPYIHTPWKNVLSTSNLEIEYVRSLVALWCA